MRTLILFALAICGTAVLTDDAAAGPFRKGRGKSSGCGGSVASTSSCGGCAGAGGSVASAGYAPGTLSGQAATIQATDGQFYTLGADGSYYAASPATFGGYSNQPTGNYRGGYRGYNQGVTPVGYTGGPGYVYPAGGVPPLAMPQPRR